jgi:hypothetical protein
MACGSDPDPAGTDDQATGDSWNAGGNDSTSGGAGASGPAAGGSGGMASVGGGGEPGSTGGGQNAVGGVGANSDGGSDGMNAGGTDAGGTNSGGSDGGAAAGGEGPTGPAPFEPTECAASELTYEENGFCQIDTNVGAKPKARAACSRWLPVLGSALAATRIGPWSSALRPPDRIRANLRWSFAAPRTKRSNARQVRVS